MSKAIKNRYYMYKEKVYYVVSFCKMKHPVSREWVDCVIYEDLKGEVQEKPNVYCRELGDFESKFTKGVFSF